MKKISVILSSVTIVTIISIAACKSVNGTPEDPDATINASFNLQDENVVKRGEYLVNIMGCHDCHSPMVMTPKGPETDKTRLLSGHPANAKLPPIDKTNAKSWALFSFTGTAMAGPWGVSFSANLTSDATGIGSWTEKQFFKAMREGKYKGLDNSRTLLPPMPWPGYAKATDEDLKAIFAYLKSTPAVQNRVPAPIPPNQIGKLND